MKKYLFTPGPTTVPPEVLEAASRPILHHRTDEYSAVFAEVNENLKKVFQTVHDVYTLASSGTGAMEAAVVNLLSAGDEALVVRGGKFGERWGEICQVYGVKVTAIDVDWGTAVDPKLIAEHLRKNPNLKAVFVTLLETSTGVLTDVEAIGRITAGTGAVLVVDAVSGIAACPCPVDAWGIDVLVAASQKALMVPPGLSFVVFSDKAWKLAESSKLPKYYWDLKAAKKNLAKNQTAYTPAVTLIVGLRQALAMILAEGMDRVLRRHEILTRAVRAAAAALGLELYPRNPATGVTAIKVPAGIDGGKLKSLMSKKYGVEVAGGQEQLKGKIIRISTLGYFDANDAIVAVSALEMALAESGYRLTPGSAARAAQEVLLKETF